MIIQITAEDIRRYAAASQDEAAVHLDAAAARDAGFEAPIAHGMYLMGLAQSLYLKEHRTQWIQAMDMRFEQPCVQGTDVNIRYPAQKQDQIRVTVTTIRGDTIAEGSFTLMEGKVDG